MHVLRATDRTQGDEPDDFCWSTPGELVRLPYEECIDRARCGCDRSVAGLTSSLATTTFEVVDAPEITLGSLRSLLEIDLALHGVPIDAAVSRWVTGAVRHLLGIAAAHPPGTVLERRGEEILVRAPPNGSEVR